jgi:hypothetical protein
MFFYKALKMVHTRYRNISNKTGIIENYGRIVENPTLKLLNFFDILTVGQSLSQNQLQVKGHVSSLELSILEIGLPS